jgi:hypothetical protein
MHNLPDIIKAIALNNKLDESRDFASMVQEALVSRLRRANRNLRSLGVKKAPFVVLIGAAMPSVLAEISFLTNKQEQSPASIVEDGRRRRNQMMRPPAMSPARTAPAMMAPVNPKAASATSIMPILAVGSSTISTMVGVIGGDGGPGA